jgi:hypothetical protein
MVRVRTDAGSDSMTPAIALAKRHPALICLWAAWRPAAGLAGHAAERVDESPGPQLMQGPVIASGNSFQDQNVVLVRDSRRARFVTLPGEDIGSDQQYYAAVGTGGKERSGGFNVEFDGSRRN